MQKGKSLYMRLSQVRILPQAVVHRKKNETFLVAVTHQILF